MCKIRKDTKFWSWVVLDSPPPPPKIILVVPLVGTAVSNTQHKSYHGNPFQKWNSLPQAWVSPNRNDRVALWHEEPLRGVKGSLLYVRGSILFWWGYLMAGGLKGPSQP